MSADTLFDDALQPTAQARFTDPETSHLAKHRQTSARMSLVQTRIVALLRVNGPLTDEQIHAEYHRVYEDHPVSASGCRTRRKEAADRGLITQADVEGKTSTGGRCTTWRAS